ncbi:MAG: hypothetical protein HY526_13025 [Betaproteobacteria bacterium]|nr:hypothetical protein [Betaproteobacteria bacterium]
MPVKTGSQFGVVEWDSRSPIKTLEDRLLGNDDLGVMPVKTGSQFGVVEWDSRSPIKTLEDRLLGNDKSAARTQDREDGQSETVVGFPP